MPPTPPTETMERVVNQEAGAASGNPNPAENNKKKKGHRRARKGKKRHSSGSNKPSVSAPKVTKKAAAEVKQKGKGQVCLRPCNNPLVNAPRNSTQFIIDDHEDNDLYLNFEGAENRGGDDTSEENSAQRSTKFRPCPISRFRKIKLIRFLSFFFRRGRF